MSKPTPKLDTLRFQTLDFLSRHGKKLLVALVVVNLLATGTVAGEDAFMGTQGTESADSGP